MGRHTWKALPFLADRKDPDKRIIAVTDERIRQILTAAAVVAGLRQQRTTREKYRRGVLSEFKDR